MERRRAGSWSLALGSVLVMTVAVQSFATTWHFPSQVANAIGCGGWHSLGIQPNGTVVAWGNDNLGQTNVPAGLAATAVAGGEAHSLALKPDSTVVAWGDNSYGESSVPAGLSNVVAIAAGGSHSMALRSSGDVVAWGDNRSGESSVPGDLLFNAIAIAAGASNSLALKPNHTVEAWGDNTYGQSTVPASVNSLSNVVAIAAGQRHSLALRADGTVVAWGDDSLGQTDVPANLGGVIAISAGAFHSLALRTNGMVVAWGANNAGQSNVPAGLSNVVAIASGDAHSLALRSDHTVVAWGDNSYGQCTVPFVHPAGFNLQDTVNGAADGDTVLVAPGQYNLTSQVTITNAITLRGEDGAGQTVFNVNFGFNVPSGNWGFWVSNSAAVIDGLTIKAPNSYDADIFLVGGTVQNCNFNNGTMLRNGEAIYMVGGILTNANVSYAGFPNFDSYAAVYCTAGGLITDSSILGGDASLGEGVYLDRSQIRNSTLSGMGPFDESPGEWAIEAHSSVITNCHVVRGGSGFLGGSGAFLDSSLMDRCTVIGCWRGTCATNDGGGGIFEINSTIRDTLIVSNSVSSEAPGCSDGVGGGVYMQGGALVNCTVAENGAVDGGGVYVQNGGSITNCIIFDNRSYNNITNQWLSDGSGIFDHCCTAPDPGGAGNIIQDPQFASLINGNFHLADNSPCVAAGVVQSWMNSAEDLDGNPRTDGGSVDLGAYESQNGQGQNTAQMVKVMDPRRINAGIDDAFTFSFQTQTNHTYTVQYTYSVSPAHWQTLTNFSGDGTMVNVTNQNPANPSCFYRVVAQ